MPALIKLDEELLKQLYCFENITQEEIASIMGVKRHTIMNRVKKLRLKRKYLDKDWLVEQHYHNQLTVQDMSLLAHCNPNTIIKYMQKFGIKTRVYPRRHEYDYTYFEKINTPNKAYWLGFIVADGGIEVSKSDKRSTYRLRIILSDKDHYHLEKFASDISSTAIVKDGTTMLKGEMFGNSSVSIYSKKIVNDLIKLGVLPNKSANEVMPKFPEEFVSHFIRGNFDGDGCFSYWYQNKTIQQELSFLGSNSLMEQISSILENLTGVKCSIESEGVLYKLRFTKINDVRKIIDWMYADTDLFLVRKYEKIIAWENLRKNYGVLDNQLVLPI